MKLPNLRDFDLTKKRVLLRCDFDVPLVAGKVVDDTRIRNSLPTINLLLSQKAKIIILAHLGRPGGRVVSELSLKPVAERLALLLYSNEMKLKKEKDGWMIGKDIFLRENLRFDPGEEENNWQFAQKLASLGEFYINNAFACSHRKHTSIVGLPRLLPCAAGLDLLKEVETLSKILENPQRPVVVILGGAKEDKLEVVDGLARWVDYILIGGRLPMLVLTPKFSVSFSSKILIAKLDKSGQDISLKTIEDFRKTIKKAKTIVWSGPMGRYEEQKWGRGTRIIAETVAYSLAFKVIGGGDTEAALTKFGLVDKIDYVSSGGGAMLEFLAKGDLPGLKALRENKL